MLPRLDRLRLKPTGEFYALSAPEVSEEPEEPIHGNPFVPGQTRDSPNATFRVRNRDPRPGTTDQYVYHFFEAASLWDWVRRPGKATNPKNRDPIWKEDWLALHDRFDPNGPVPDWVSRLPQLDPAFNDPRANAPVAAARPEYVNDVILAYNISWNFANNTHYGNPVEQQLTELRQTLRTIRDKYDNDFEGNDYRGPLMEYDNSEPFFNPNVDVRDLINNLLEIVIVRTAPFLAKSIAIGFVAKFLSPSMFEGRVAACVRDDEEHNLDELRRGLGEYLVAIEDQIPAVQPLHRQLARLHTLSVRHHTFWKRPILDRQLKGPPPSAKITAPMLTGYADALMISLKEKVEAAINEIGYFTHEEDDVENFFQLEEYAHYSRRTPYDVATELLEEIRNLFRKTLTYTEKDDGRQRTLTITFFANVLNVFVELSMWNDADDTLFSDHWNEDVQNFANKLASTLRSVLRYEDSVSTRSDAVTTFFWWYVAPLYEAAASALQVQLVGLHVIERDDVLKGLSLLDETVERLPADPPTDAAHERPAGEATPGRRRQRTGELEA